MLPTGQKGRPLTVSELKEANLLEERELDIAEEMVENGYTCWPKDSVKTRVVSGGLPQGLPHDLDKNVFANNVGQIKKLFSTKIATKINPEVYSSYFPKTFMTPSTHYDPWLYGAVSLTNRLAMESGLDRVTGLGKHTNTSIVEFVHEQCKRYNHPTYFLDDQVCRMIDKTTISETIPLNQISFPMPAMVVSLPKGTFKINSDQGETDVVALGMSVSYSYDHPLKTMSRPRYMEKMRAEILATEELNKSSLHSIPWAEFEESGHKTLNSSFGTLRKSVSMVGVFADATSVVAKYFISDQTIQEALTQHMSDFQLDYQHMNNETLEDCQDQLCRVASFMIKLIVFMSSKNEDWIPENTIAKPAKYKKGKLKSDAKWSANFIGKTYGQNLTNNGYNAPEKDGRKLRYHWRQGHIKGQWYGKNKSQYKTIWVDPYPVNKPI